jgi:acyl-coenzyme A thioesterase PaaI-like protein
MMIQNCFVHIPDDYLASVEIGMVPVLRDVKVTFTGTAFIDRPVTFEAEVIKERVGKISVVEYTVKASQDDKPVAEGTVKIMVTGSW